MKNLNKIKKIRNELGLSVYKIADQVGVTPSYISNLENGHRVNPSREVMEKVSIALGQTVSEIFFPEEG